MLKLKNSVLKDMDIRYCSKGFTYIELALAMAIIAIIVLAFAQLFLRTTVSVKSMEFQTLAYNFAADGMEEIKDMAFDGIGDPWHPNIWLAQVEPMAGNNFTRNVRVSALTDSLRRVDIEVIWTEGGENRNIEISSLIVDRW